MNALGLLDAYYGVAGAAREFFDGTRSGDGLLVMTQSPLVEPELGLRQVTRLRTKRDRKTVGRAMRPTTTVTP
jgi:hypothetical protein